MINLIEYYDYAIDSDLWLFRFMEKQAHEKQFHAAYCPAQIMAAFNGCILTRSLNWSACHRPQDEGRGAIEPALPARLEGTGEIKEADYAVWLKEYSGKA